MAATLLDVAKTLQDLEKKLGDGAHLEIQLTVNQDSLGMIVFWDDGLSLRTFFTFDEMEHIVDISILADVFVAKMKIEHEKFLHGGLIEL